MTDSTTPARPGRPAGLPTVGIDAEVEAKFVEGLRQFGTPDAAARYARPHLAARGSKRASYRAFREHARRNPEFAAACEDALSDYRGEIERLIHERAVTVDQRPVFNPKTGEMVLAEDRRNANDMLKMIAARVDPMAWAPRKNVNVDSTVTINGGTALTGGQAYIVKPDDMLMLDAAEQRTLIDLLVKIETARKAAEPQPEPVRPYATFLPAPGETNGR